MDVKLTNNVILVKSTNNAIVVTISSIKWREFNLQIYVSTRIQAVYYYGIFRKVKYRYLTFSMVVIADTN